VGAGRRQEVSSGQGRKQTGGIAGSGKWAGGRWEELVFDNVENHLEEELMPVLGIWSFEPNHSGSGTY
jgi:hypothetical protein